MTDPLNSAGTLLIGLGTVFSAVAAWTGSKAKKKAEPIARIEQKVDRLEAKTDNAVIRTEQLHTRIDDLDTRMDRQHQQNTSRLEQLEDRLDEHIAATDRRVRTEPRPDDPAHRTRRSSP